MNSITTIDSLEEQLKYNTEVYHSSIVDQVKFNNFFLNKVDCVKRHVPRINQLHTDGRYREAGELFLTVLKKSGDVGRWQQFRDALQQEGYDVIVKLLNGDIVNSEQNDEKKRIIQLFQERIVQNINANELWFHMKEKDLISNIEAEEMTAIINKQGSTLACLYFLDNMWRRKENWYEEFLNILIRINVDHVAYMIDPDYVEKKRVQEASLRQERDMDTVESSTVEEHGEGYFSQKNLAVPTNDGNNSSQTSEHNWNICEPETNQELNKLTPDKIICHPTDDSNPSDLAAHPSDKENIDDKYMNNTTDSEAHHSDDDNVDNVDSVDNDATEATSDASDDVPAKTLQLRPYQEELATLAVAGKNVIIVAPTGSGKTIVAVKIMQEHLKKRGVGVRKILFLVNQVLLAKQQHDACKEYMSDCPLELISGNTQITNKVPLNYLLERHNILFMTAQIFLDGLREKEIDSLSAVSLIVFDECHHTKMRHTFNQIMHLYMELKFGLNAEHVRLPQIVGLTASVGVGKANTLDGAVDHIKNLCANLDADIVTVQNNVENMVKYVKITALDVKECKKRPVDKFHAFIEKTLMQQIEDRILTYVTDTQVVAALQTKLKSPTQHGCIQYKQWVSTLRNEVCKIENQEIHKLLFCSCMYLEMYNDALILNEDCRTIDAFLFLKNEFYEINDPRKQHDRNEMEKLVIENFEKNEKYLEVVSKAPESKNPKIECLESMLRSVFLTNPESRAMVFVKTREMTIALKKWMMETSGLKELNPGILTGARVSSSKGGMTKSGQVDVLKYFRDGQHKLIISTSIGEEGLDISACNLVIRYDHVTNEIAMVQARGRARAENSKYKVIGSAEKNTVKKEQLNLMREMLMIQAIQKVQQDAKDADQFQKQIEEIQTKAKVEREIEALTHEGRRLREGDFQLLCCQCRKFVCMSTDIKTINGTQRVILIQDIDQRVTYTPHPKPEIFQTFFQKKEKMSCKCGFDLGISVIYERAKYPIAKIENYIIVDSKGNSDRVKRWKYSPFITEEISQEDKIRQLSLLSDGSGM